MYRSTVLGEIVYFAHSMVCVVWVVLLGIIVFDCYNMCEWGGIDSLCLYGKYVGPQC